MAGYTAQDPQELAMSRYHTRRLMPYSAAQLHAMVLDIERYPEFVPGYQGAAIEQRGEGHINVVQTIGVGPATVRFHSQARYEVSSLIHILAQDGPFKQLEVEWNFCDTDEGCEVEFLVEYHLHGLFAPLLRSWLQLTAPQLLAVFARRAVQLYGAPN